PPLFSLSPFSLGHQPPLTSASSHLLSSSSISLFSLDIHRSRNHLIGPLPRRFALPLDASAAASFFSPTSDAGSHSPPLPNAKPPTTRKTTTTPPNQSPDLPLFSLFFTSNSI
ncbi:hypothetical protein HAX54_009134, partial [Datura stramonium]|nr:hypothetical protein [Datura stramonium]